MAIAFDTANTAQINGATLSWSHTCTGANLILVVGVCYIHTGVTPPSVLTITYNSVLFTKIRRDVGANSNFSELWYLIAPATGANTVTVTFTGAPDHLGVTGSISLTGVNQSSPIDGQNGASAASGQPSLSITTTTASDWIVDVVTDNAQNTSTATPAGSQVEQWSNSFIGNSQSGFGSTLGPISPAGATTMAWTGLTSAWVQSAAAFMPFGVVFQPDEDLWIPPMPAPTDSIISIW